MQVNSNSKKNQITFSLLSHHGPEKLHRTIQISLLGKNAHLCARCFGKYLGWISVIVTSLLLNFPSWYNYFIFLLLPLPSIVDWTSQKVGLRESKNWIRVITGYLLGLAQGYLVLSIIEGMIEVFLFGVAIVILYIFSIGFFLAKKR